MTLDKNLQEMWLKEKKRFNQPALNDPELVPALEGQDSAALDWEARRIRVSQGFVKELTTDLPEEKALKSIVRHELGHWCYFPQDLAQKLYLLAEADGIFKGKATAIYQWYSDLANEGALLTEAMANEEILEMREVFAKKANAKKDEISAALNNLLRGMYLYQIPEFYEKTMGKKKQTDEGILKTAPTGLTEDEKKAYLHKEREKLDAEFVKKLGLTKKEQEIFGKTKNVPFINLSIEEHLASLYRFGKAVEELIPPEIVIKIGCCGNGSLNGIPIAALDGALSGILNLKGVRAYNIVKGMLKKLRPDFDDPFDERPKTAAIGAGHADFKRNDNFISLYDRWASGAIYIVKRPVEKDATALFRSGKKEFEVGDPVHKIDVFGSRGMIGIPGISKVHQEETGTIPSVEFSIPHLNLGIDSSGSMAHPNAPRGASQILAAFIIGKNYHANGSMVGGWNFSEDIAFLPPNRDLDAYFSLMCGYWGGGTYLNIDKLKKFVAQSRFGEKEIQFSDEQDYKHLLARMTEEEKKQVMDKNLHLDMKKIKAKYEKLDNVLITDGAIGNAEDVLRYLQSLGEITRNFVFITDKGIYKDWKKLESTLPNTFVYEATTPEDLRNLAMGRSKALVTESHTNYRRVQ